MQRISLCKIASPLERRERPAEGPVSGPSVHQTVLRIVEIAVVESRGLVRLNFGLRLAQGLAETPDAPVVVSVFESAGGTLANAGVARHIAEAVIQLPAETAARRHRRMHRMGVRCHRLPQHIDIIATEPCKIGVGDQRSRVVADHAAAVAGRRPFRQEAALPEVVGESLLDLDRLLRIHQVEQREKAPERIPEACIGE